MAAAIGASHVTTWKRVRRLGIRISAAGASDEESRVPAPIGSHVEGYKLARRGFYVPAHLESQYFELLKAGVPIAEACRRLKITTNQRSEA
ncbi:hypothetical protein NFC69_01060 [Rhizobium sp. SSA_523]|nr:hypothetical protein [Rhizobium sp. SSA_523]WKC25199.1 hypothetical protein QTJ18_14530 [Rhizobium sp. SSA_523]